MEYLQCGTYTTYNTIRPRPQLKLVYSTPQTDNPRANIITEDSALTVAETLGEGILHQVFQVDLKCEETSERQLLSPKEVSGVNRPVENQT